MRSIYVSDFSDLGLIAPQVGDLDPEYPLPASPGDPDPAGWVRVHLRAASLNHHDLWSLRGVGLAADRLPMVLGTDAAGVTDDGDAVIVHSVISSPDWDGDETLDPRRTLLSEKYPGTLAEVVRVPRANLIAKPASLTFAEAACLPTAYLTAYRLLFDAADVRPGQRVLIQGASGGVATAATLLARAAGAHVTVTSRAESNLARARAIGAHEAVLSGERIESVDAVIETVGKATWSHSLRSLRPGGVVAVAGATSGPAPSADLNRVFFRSLRIVGTTMGTRAQLRDLIGFLGAADLRPVIGGEYDFDDDASVQAAFADLAAGRIFGKAVLTRSGQLGEAPQPG